MRVWQSECDVVDRAHGVDVLVFWN